MANKVLNHLVVAKDGVKYERNLKQIDTNQRNIKAVTDVIGTNAEHAALIEKNNVFSNSQTFDVKSQLSGTNTALDLTATTSYQSATADFADAATTAHFGVKVVDNASTTIGTQAIDVSATKIVNAMTLNNKEADTTAAISLEYDPTQSGDAAFKATAPSTADGAVGKEIVTADWANRKLSNVEGNLKDATDTQRGFVKLSDAVDSDLAAATGKTAASPLAVKKVQDDLNTKHGEVTGDIAAFKAHAAYTDAENVFTKDQTIAVPTAGTADSNKVLLQTKNFDAAAATFDGSVTSADANFMLVDKNKKSIAGVSASTTEGKYHAKLSAFKKDGGSESITISYDSGTEKVTTSAPNPEDGASGNEIATASWVKARIQDPSLIISATTENKGVVELATNEEALAGTDNTLAVTPAALAHALQPIKDELAATESGVTNFALKDYTQTVNQTEMLLGVIYLVAFNASNQYLQLDKNNGYNPAADQAPEVLDKAVAYYIKMVKHTAEGPAVEAGRIYTATNLQGVAYHDKVNTFTKSNAFNAGASVTGGFTADTATITTATVNTSLTVTGTSDFQGAMTATTITANTGAEVSSGGNAVPNAGQVKSYVDTNIQKTVSDLSVKLTESAPDVGDMVEGAIYFVYGDEETI